MIYKDSTLLASACFGAILLLCETGYSQLFYWGGYRYSSGCANGQCQTVQPARHTQSQPATPAPEQTKTPEKAPSVQADTPEPDEQTLVTPADVEQSASADNQQESFQQAAERCFFSGVEADKWQIALEAVCEQRGLSVDAVAAKLGDAKIQCCSSAFGAYAGCTWGGSGSVSKVDIVKSNCYNVEAVRRHEASHVVTFLIDDGASLFMHEGMSQICEKGGQRRAYLNRAVAQSDDATSFIDWIYRNSYDNQYKVYTFSYAVFEYLREAGGSCWLEGMLNEALRTSFNSALLRWYNLTPEQLNANVKRLIREDSVKALY